MLFKEYIKLNNKDITVELDHLSSITFDDICTLIYLITNNSAKVQLSDEAKIYLDYKLFDYGTTIVLKQVENCEELAILMYVSHDEYVGSTFPVDIGYKLEGKENYLFNPKYVMSNRFTLVAKKYGMYDHPYVKRIICNYNISDTYDNTKASASFEEYMK